MNKETAKKKIVKVRTISGVVVSNKNDKTVVVEVTRTKIHHKYGKRYQVSRRLKAHDEKDEYQVGDQVIIKACRPISKEKRWRVEKKAAEASQ